MERLLCIKIASRGDLLLAGPAFRHLRDTRPGARITLLVGASCEDVARHLPFFDEIRVMDDHALMASGRLARFHEARRLLEWMTAERHDEVFIFHRDWRYGLLAEVAGVPARHGFHHGILSGFLTRAYRAGEHEHHVSQYLGMIGVANGADRVPSIAGSWKFADREREQALRAAVAQGFDPTRGTWLALGFGGGRNVKTQTPLKTWPLAHYRSLAATLEARGHRIAWVGDSHDAVALTPPHSGLNLAGKLSVPETAAVLSACRAVVSNDSLTLHLGEALGIPTVGIFGPTDPGHYRPLGNLSAHVWHGENLPCSPCHRDGWFPVCGYRHRCMNDLSVESVLLRLEPLL